MRLLLALLLASLAPSAVPRQEAPARPSRYRLEVAVSSLRWELPATLHIVRGIAPVFHGSIETDAAVPGGWLGRIVVPAASMVTGNRRRDRTMRDKILETDRYPEIVFELKSLTGDVSQLRPGDSFTVQVAGDLTVHGRKATVQLPVDVHVFADSIVIAGSFPLHWREFGLTDPSFGVVKVKEPMLVLFRLRAVPAE